MKENVEGVSSGPDDARSDGEDNLTERQLSVGATAKLMRAHSLSATACTVPRKANARHVLQAGTPHRTSTRLYRHAERERVHCARTQRLHQRRQGVYLDVVE